MNRTLLYNLPLLLQRVGEWAVTHRRLKRLRGTVAGALQDGHIDSLELLELVRPLNPMAIFDIGANVGTWTLLARALYPEATIQAFEPMILHAKKFEETIRGLSKITLHKVALLTARLSYMSQILPTLLAYWSFAKLAANFGI